MVARVRFLERLCCTCIAVSCKIDERWRTCKHQVTSCLVCRAVMKVLRIGHVHSIVYTETPLYGQFYGQLVPATRFLETFDGKFGRRASRFTRNANEN